MYFPIKCSPQTYLEPKDNFNWWVHKGSLDVYGQHLVSPPGQAFPCTDIFLSCLFSFVTTQHFHFYVYEHCLSLLANPMFPTDILIYSLRLILISDHLKFSLWAYGQHLASPPGQAFQQTDIFTSLCLFSFVTAISMGIVWIYLPIKCSPQADIFRTSGSF